MDNVTSRRNFLLASAAITAAAAVPSVVSAAPSSQGVNSMSSSTARNRAHAIFNKPEYQFGMGGVPFGNEFNKLSDRDVEEAMNAAWELGVRYFDMAPWYGLGLAERRFGNFLRGKPRSEYIISSKVGKIFKAARNNNGAKYYPLADSPNNIIFDYTGDGVKRSIEDSLQRLGVDSLDVAFVHDISPDFPFFPANAPWEEQFRVAAGKNGAFEALTRMREEGIIKAWGIGVNCPEPIIRAMEVADLDVCLCASQYSLIDHHNTVEHLFPAVKQKNVSLVMGSALNAGFISGSPRYNYGPDSYKISPEHIKKRDQLRTIAGTYGVDLRTAALKFSAAAELAVAMVVGVSNRRQIEEDYNSLQTRIPAEFWAELQKKNLIHPNAVIPA